MAGHAAYVSEQTRELKEGRQYAFSSDDVLQRMARAMVVMRDPETQSSRKSVLTTQLSKNFGSSGEVRFSFFGASGDAARGGGWACGARGGADIAGVPEVTDIATM